MSPELSVWGRRFCQVVHRVHFVLYPSQFRCLVVFRRKPHGQILWAGVRVSGLRIVENYLFAFVTHHITRARIDWCRKGFSVRPKVFFIFRKCDVFFVVVFFFNQCNRLFLFKYICSVWKDDIIADYWVYLTANTHPSHDERDSISWSNVTPCFTRSCCTSPQSDGFWSLPWDTVESVCSALPGVSPTQPAFATSTITVV